MRPPSIRVSDLLEPRMILFAEPGQGKSVLLDELIKRVAARHGLADTQALAARVREREQGISTTLDTGVSLPHARVDGLGRIAAALAVARAPIEDPGSPDIPIRAIFLFFSPNKQEFFGLHLQVLRGVSSLFSTAILDRLAAAKSSEEALAMLRAAEPAR